jgi:type IV pilus assembly protein PilA
MVVVLIIAILIAIAIPTFLGARKRAQDRAVQSNLRNALTAEKTFYTDSQAYSDSATSLKDIEPSLTFVTASADLVAGGKTVLVDAQDANSTTDAMICLSAKSASGTTFGLKDIAVGANAGTYFYKDAPTCDDSNASGDASW